MPSKEPVRYRLARVVPLVVIALAAALPFAHACYAGWMSQEPPPVTEASIPFSYTADGGVLLAYGLPPPEARQRKAPCDPEVGQEEFNGHCWLPLPVKPPCPVGKAWEEGGKCYVPVLRAEKAPRPPTSGAERYGSGVAGP
jgi:hypothetical protein